MRFIAKLPELFCCDISLDQRADQFYVLWGLEYRYQKNKHDKLWTSRFEKNLITIPYNVEPRSVKCYILLTAISVLDIGMNTLF